MVNCGKYGELLQTWRTMANYGELCQVWWTMANCGKHGELWQVWWTWQTWRTMANYGELWWTVSSMVNCGELWQVWWTMVNTSALHHWVTISSQVLSKTTQECPRYPYVMYLCNIQCVHVWNSEKVALTAVKCTWHIYLCLLVIP
jgi:hypothetical protein